MAVALLLLLLSFLLPTATSQAGDHRTLLDLKAGFTGSSALSSWSESIPPCDQYVPLWTGVSCALDGDVTGLRLEHLSLSGSINVDALLRLKSLRGLSFINNSFSGPIPPFSRLEALKALHLSLNNFNGMIPDDFFVKMDNLKKLYLGNNQFSGPIPSSLSKAALLIELDLRDNQFTGEIPLLNVADLQYVNLSNNNLTGPIPAALAAKFKASSFSNNPGLCGPPLADKPCSPTSSSSPSLSPPSGSVRTQKIIVAVVIAVVVLLVAAMIVAQRRRLESKTVRREMEAGEGEGRVVVLVKNVAMKARGVARRGGGEKGGELVMVNEAKGVFVMSDMMKAAAAVMGTGGIGTVYKAVLANGETVVVKRMREMNGVGKEAFDAEMRRLGRVKHKNVLPPLAFHYKEEEKLLILEHAPKGSLLYVLHGK